MELGGTQALKMSLDNLALRFLENHWTLWARGAIQMIIRNDSVSMFIGNLKKNEQRSTAPPKQVLMQNHDMPGNSGW